MNATSGRSLARSHPRPTVRRAYPWLGHVQNMFLLERLSEQLGPMAHGAGGRQRYGSSRPWRAWARDRKMAQRRPKTFHRRNSRNLLSSSHPCSGGAADLQRHWDGRPRDGKWMRGCHDGEDPVGNDVELPVWSQTTTLGIIAAARPRSSSSERGGSATPDGRRWLDRREVGPRLA